MSYAAHIEAFLKHGLFLPPYVNNQTLNVFYEEAITNKDSQCFYEKVLPIFDDYFNEYRIAAYYNEVYKKNKFIKKFHAQIIESITAYKIGYVSVSVAALVSVIEGCVVDIFNDIERKERESGRKFPLLAEGGDKQKKFKYQLKSVTDYVAEKSRCGDLYVTQERLDVINSFEKYISSQFWSNSSSRKEPSLLSRNGINHGAYSSDEFAQPINFYKLLMMINFFHFACAFIGFDGSVSDPKYRPEHEKTAAILLIASKIKIKKILHHS